MNTRLRFLGVVVLGAVVSACASGESSESEGASPEGPGWPQGVGDGEDRGTATPAGPDGSSLTGSDDAVASESDPGVAMGEAPGGLPVTDSAGAPAPVAVTPGSVAGPAAGPAAPGVTPSAPADGDSASLPVPPASGGSSGVAEPPIESPEPAPVTPQAQAGLLTAGTWDDNLNFERFLDYRDELVGSQMAGLLPIEEAEHVSANEQGMGTPRKHTTLDIALVVDTTGSMGDELYYLQTEFDALAARISDAYPDAKQRWALVLYRDQGDEYVTRWFDFRDDLEDFQAKLAEQSAGGGGDFPEAPDEALTVTTELAWRSGEKTARLAFWIADAPHHAENAAVLADAIRVSQSMDVHVYPVASSGVDELTELSMRSAAQLTGGRYLFLTDDSGVGGEHKEPSIPCYYVTRLDNAVLRMVDIEMSGEYQMPTPDEIVRTSGEPEDGACLLQSGKMVAAY